MHRLRAAYVFLRQRKPEEAAVHARAALANAVDEQQRRRAQELLDLIAQARAGGAP